MDKLHGDCHPANIRVSLREALSRDSCVSEMRALNGVAYVASGRDIERLPDQGDLALGARSHVIDMVMVLDCSDSRDAAEGLLG